MLYTHRVFKLKMFTGCIFVWPKGFKKNLIIFFFFFGCVVSLCCYAQAFSSCGELGLLFVVVCRLLIAVASLVAEHRL